jgi:hypothetical protein
MAVPEATRFEPDTWARTIFDPGSAPGWVQALFALREVFAKALGVPPGSKGHFQVDEVVAGEAVIDVDDRHLRFVAAIRPEEALVHVTTAVVLKGRRGRAYFLPVRFLHEEVVRAMIGRAARRLQEKGGAPVAA